MAHLFLDGSGAYASTPDTPAVSITGDIDIRARVAPTTWAAGSALQAVVSQNEAGNRAFSFFIVNSGVLRLTHFADGSTPITNLSTVATGFSAGTTNWIRVTLDVDNGAGGYDVKFWTADGALTNPGPGDFSQLGATLTGAGTTSIFDSASDLNVGVSSASGSNPFSGNVYRAQVYDGIDGTPVFDGDPSDPNTWTYN